MLLAIDIGNSHTQLGVFAGEDLVAEWRLSTARHRTVDEAGLLSRSLFDLEGIDSTDVGGMVLASVVPPLTGVFETMGREYFALEPLVVTPDLIDDLPVLYEPRGDVGSDRIVNAVAVREIYGVPAVVVDFGTATTFDVIDSRGAYLGGVIATGVSTSADALFARAARLPRVDLARPASVIGRNTVESVQAGLFWGYADLVDGLLERIVEALGETPRVVATGGWASTLGPACKRIEAVDDLLTLNGLRLIHHGYGG